MSSVDLRVWASKLPPELRALVANIWDESDTNPDAFASGKSYWIELKPNLIWDGEVHQIHEGGLRDLRRALRNVKPCNCGHCDDPTTKKTTVQIPSTGNCVVYLGGGMAARRSLVLRQLDFAWKVNRVDANGVAIDSGEYFNSRSGAVTYMRELVAAEGLS